MQIPRRSELGYGLHHELAPMSSEMHPSFTDSLCLHLKTTVSWGRFSFRKPALKSPNFRLTSPRPRIGKPFQLGEHFRISGNGRLEANRPTGPKAYPVRLQTYAVIRGVTRAAQAGIPIGSATKEWLQSALRAPDFRSEAEKCLRNPQGEK